MGPRCWRIREVPQDEQAYSRPLVDKPFSCLEVEPAEGARPEVQATTITLKVTPVRGWESMALKIKSNFIVGTA